MIQFNQIYFTCNRSLKTPLWKKSLISINGLFKRNSSIFLSFNNASKSIIKNNNKNKSLNLNNFFNKNLSINVKQSSFIPFRFLDKNFIHIFNKISKKNYATFRDIRWTAAPKIFIPNRREYFFKYGIKILAFTIAFSVITHYGLPYLFSIPPLNYFKSHPEHLVPVIIGLNILVYPVLMSRLPARWAQYFVLSSNISAVKLPSMILSAFTHSSFMHILFNMTVLYSFGTTSPQTFLDLYLNAAIWSSFTSVMLPFALKRFGGPFSGTVGASGAIFGVMGAFSYLFPDARLSLFFVPLPIGAWYVFLIAVGLDLAQLFRLPFAKIDYSGHLGGALVGVIYGAYIKKEMEKKRRAFEIRQRPGWF